MIDKAFHMPGMPAAGLPSGTQPFADMSQGLTWMQNMWSSYMNSPMAPTLDIDELDRRIKDLKAVESIKPCCGPQYKAWRFNVQALLAFVR
ncbi:MAG: hypothetical protein RLZZ613_1317 [Pseudomonadota bacterium]